jgi:hypothetical protein
MRKPRKTGVGLVPLSQVAFHNRSDKEIAVLMQLRAIGELSKATSDFDIAISKARSGDHKMAHFLFDYFIRHVKANDPLTVIEQWRVVEFIAERLENLLIGGGDPLKALGLARPRRGRPAKNFAGFLEASELAERIAKGEKHSAVLPTIVKPGVSASTIERAYRKHFKKQRE